ncbi:CU044_5270 family protein [Streptomyces nigrescens]|uniref:CU044_5270 family protein n=1 Tax=Streptomyces nigrescens TaxID=1920 RepID=A0ABY7J7D4_STRNI|nr:CU044_5270 family protein [Streptomyces nigrescens]MCW7984196.1 2-oxoglutarate dehydrogenase [Streptomyces platensis subsp. clarensis]WAU07261.1 CU044_5270 family protein [Streptomyces nigrescens]
MTEELELLRQADPVSADEGPWRDRPLTARAEARLAALTTGAVPRGRPRPVRRRRLLMGLTAVSAAAVAALVLTFSGAGSSPAVAAPAALPLHADAPSVSLDLLARRAEARARTAAAEDGPRRGSHLQSWYMSMETGPDAAPPVTVPEERITSWNDDGSGSELVVATDPRHPGRPVIHDNDGEWQTVSDGKVLHRKTYPAGSEAQHSGLAGRTKPPTDAGALREQLSWLYGGAGGTSTTPQLLSALSSFRQEWTPGPRETAAIVRMLADADGLRQAGVVTDRLGRRGQAYVYDGPDGATNSTRQMVILDPRTGELLGLEITFTKDEPEFRIRSGEVMSYEAWMP